MRYVYILKGDIKHYVGYTSDLESRFKRHLRGHTSTTKGMGDLKIVGYFVKETKQDAIQLERKIKKNGHIDSLDKPGDLHYISLMAIVA